MNKTYLAVAVFIIFVAALVGISLTQTKIGASQTTNSFNASRAFTGATSTPAGSSVVVLTAKTGRQYAIITNASATPAYLGFKSTTTGLTTNDFPIYLGGNSSFTIGFDNLYTGQVLASSTSGVINLKTLEVY